ncbi:MAG: sigma-54-dependent Fis family transcriptional regulator [Gammaproteobacteria bacterium]
MSQTPMRAAHAPAIESLRRQFFDGGDVPDAGLPATVLRSWQRCQRLGMENTERGRPSNTTRGDLMVARERNAALLNHAGGVMEHLYEQIRASGSMVLLADASGLILHGIGDPAFVDRASRVALQPGASWSECQRGTNAIGATLIERAPVEVFGAEHYLDCNGVLTCSAAPILDCRGELLGALDISGDHRQYQPHTLGLARMGVRLVERHMFESEYARHALFAFHPRPEGVGGLQEGLLAVDADGEIVAADRQARALLGIEAGRSLGLGSFGNLFRNSFGTVISRAGRDPGSLMALELRAGATVYARVRVSLAWHVGLQAAQARGGARAARAPDPSRSARSRVTLETLATGDAGLQLALDRCAKVVGRNIPILIQGESGSGKELLARACHNSGPRADGPFVAVNCAAIPENLIESELFGYVGGAFTGARKEGAIGRIQQAHGGTLFLDEIGDMPLAMQARLLRVLQERCVQPVGAAEPVAVDIALLCATHRVLSDSVKAGRFREDLYYRVNSLTAQLPPLRERSDLRAIIRRLLDGSRHHPEPTRIDVAAETMAILEAYAWPGNIRQLQNVLEVALALLDEDEDCILPAHLPEEVLQGADDAPVERQAAREPVATATAALARGRRPKDIDDATIRAALERFDGNLSAAARHLGVARNTLYRRMGCDF